MYLILAVLRPCYCDLLLAFFFDCLFNLIQPPDLVFFFSSFLHTPWANVCFPPPVRHVHPYKKFLTPSDNIRYPLSTGAKGIFPSRCWHTDAFLRSALNLQIPLFLPAKASSLLPFCGCSLYLIPMYSSPFGVLGDATWSCLERIRQLLRAPPMVNRTPYLSSSPFYSNFMMLNG